MIQPGEPDGAGWPASCRARWHGHRPGGWRALILIAVSLLVGCNGSDTSGPSNTVVITELQARTLERRVTILNDDVPPP